MPMTSPTRRLNYGQVRFTKVTLFLGLYATVILTPALLAVFGSAWLRRTFPSAWWFMPVALFGILVTVAPIVYLAVVRRLEGELLRDQRRYHRTLITASSGMTRIKEIQRLCKLITRMVNRTVGLTNTSLFLCEPKEQRYTLQAVRYRSLIPSDLSVEHSDPVITL